MHNLFIFILTSRQTYAQPSRLPDIPSSGATTPREGAAASYARDPPLSRRRSMAVGRRSMADARAAAYRGDVRKPLFTTPELEAAFE